MKYCSPAVLVALDVELPTDPTIANVGPHPTIGCNHLVCDGCGAEVRHADSRSITSNYPPPRDGLAALYDSADPSSSTILDAAPLHRQSRAYFCRCSWAAVDLGGTKSLGSIDAPWGCGGHRIPTGEKIRIVTPRVNPEFGTVKQLRDALLGSYPDAAYFGGPFVGCNRDDVMPAWAWVVQLVRMRSDWWPAIGIALQHAATDGGELARTAMADLLAGFRDSIALVPWTEQLAHQWPDVKATTTGTGWGAPDLRLETILRDRQRFREHLDAAGDEVFLMGYGRAGKAISGPLTNEAELRALLDKSARAGQFPDGDKGPWSWLGFELLTHGEWLRAALLRVVLTIDAADEGADSGSARTASLFALLDWFSEERDLWRFEPLLADWYAKPPTWANTPANTKPKSWRRTIRSSHWPDVETLADVVSHAYWRARKQLATAPIIDLPQLYGSTIRTRS